MLLSLEKVFLLLEQQKFKKCIGGDYVYYSSTLKPKSVHKHFLFCQYFLCIFRYYCLLFDNFWESDKSTPLTDTFFRENDQIMNFIPEKWRKPGFFTHWKLAPPSAPHEKRMTPKCHPFWRRYFCYLLGCSKNYIMYWGGLRLL